MKTIMAFTGKLGSGKDYQTMRAVSSLKELGNTIFMISFADPFKQILANSFGFDKNGKIKENYTPLTKMYVKWQVVDSLYYLIKNLNSDKCLIFDDGNLKSDIARNYEKHEDVFYNHLCNANIGLDYAFDFRKLLQLFGTELGRHILDSIWVDITIDKILKVFNADLANYVFINDCRFINEYSRLIQLKEETSYDVKIYGVVASDETRASRRGLSLYDLKMQDNHASEASIDAIISLLPEENVIINN
jgi:hypothetical protein